MNVKGKKQNLSFAQNAMNAACFLVVFVLYAFVVTDVHAEARCLPANCSTYDVYNAVLAQEGGQNVEGDITYPPGSHNCFIPSQTYPDCTGCSYGRGQVNVCASYTSADALCASYYAANGITIQTASLHDYGSAGTYDENIYNVKARGACLLSNNGVVADQMSVDLYAAKMAANCGSCPSGLCLEGVSAYNGGSETYVNGVLSHMNCVGATSVTVSGVTTGGTTTSTEKTVDLSSCASPTQSMQELMDAMANAMQISAEKRVQAQKQLLPTPRNVKKSYCIGKELEMMDWTSVRTMILGLLVQAVTDAITQILDYICAEEHALTQNLLNKFCVPMPTFGRVNLGLEADGIDSCNGTALLTMRTASDTVVLPLTSASSVQNLFKTLGDKLK